jgi:signal peptidase
VSWALTLALVAGWFIFFRPAPLWGPASYVFVSGESMEPTYHEGDLVVARARPTYEVGDAIVYRVPEGQAGAGQHVIHRIVGGNGTAGYVTQGDNRDSEDIWRPTDHDVAGKAWLHVGGVLRWILLLRTPLVIALFAGLWVFIAIAWPGRKDPEPAIA